MPVLTIRLSEDEERTLGRRARQAGLKRSTFVRKLIREEPYETAADVLADMERFRGDTRLRVRRRR